MTVKFTYQAFSPADDGELVAEGYIRAPDDADDPAIHGLLRNAVERKARIDDGAQVRVIATRAGDSEPHYWHVWDHGA